MLIRHNHKPFIYASVRALYASTHTHNTHTKLLTVDRSEEVETKHF